MLERIPYNIDYCLSNCKIIDIFEIHTNNIDIICYDLRDKHISIIYNVL